MDNRQFQEKSEGMTMDDITKQINYLHKLPPPTYEDFKCILKAMCLHEIVYECSPGYFKIVQHTQCHMENI